MSKSFLVFFLFSQWILAEDQSSEEDYVFSYLSRASSMNSAESHGELGGNIGLGYRELNLNFSNQIYTYMTYPKEKEIKNLIYPSVWFQKGILSNIDLGFSTAAYVGLFEQMSGIVKWNLWDHPDYFSLATQAQLGFIRVHSSGSGNSAAFSLLVSKSFLRRFIATTEIQTTSHQGCYPLCKYTMQNSGSLQLQYRFYDVWFLGASTVSTFLSPYAMRETSLQVSLNL